MTVREKIISDLSILNEVQLKQVADYLNFLKFQPTNHTKQKKKDSLFNLGKKPTKVDVSDASENLDEYLY